MHRIALVALALFAVTTLSCGSSRPMATTPSRMNSTLPCSEQCGGDVQCFQGCQPVSNQVPLPGSVTH